MKYLTAILALSVIFLPRHSAADALRLVSDTIIHYQLPSSRWQVSVEPPQLAIDAMYVDLVHDKKKKGEDFDPDTLRSAAVRFLQTNNLYIYNVKSEAYLMISLSPYAEKSGPPNAKTIRNSAERVATAISEHADVDDLTPYRTTISAIEIPGMKYATRIDSNFPLFGEPHRFIGIVAFSHPYWIFIYYNDKLASDSDLAEMQEIFRSVRLENIK